MAAWLVYLKSELLLPIDKFDNDNSAEELAKNLKFQLLRLDAMRSASIKLMSNDQLGRDFFTRGEEAQSQKRKNVVHTASLLEVLQAYAQLKTKDNFEPLHLNRTFIFGPEEALGCINKILQSSTEWQLLEKFVPVAWKENALRTRSATATNFSVFLELARLNKVEIMQSGSFTPIYLRGTEGILSEEHQK